MKTIEYFHRVYIHDRNLRINSESHV